MTDPGRMKPCRVLDHPAVPEGTASELSPFPSAATFGVPGQSFPGPPCAQCQPTQPRVLEPVDAKLRKRRSGTRPPKRNRARGWKGVDRHRHSRGQMARGVPFPNAQLCRELRSLHRNAASGLRALPAEVAGDQGCQGAPGAGAKELREQAGGALMGAAPVQCSAPAEAPEHCPQVAGCRRCEAARKAPRIQPSATKLLGGGYVTFHRGHCGCQEEQQQAIQGHCRPAAPRPSRSQGRSAGRAPRPGAPLRSPPVASPYPFAL